MQNQITVNSQPIRIKEYNGQRVITFKEIDQVHKRPSGTARKRFNENKKRLILGEDYFVRNPDEALNELGIIAPNGLYLLTETGYLMLVKSFTDDLAWQVQRALVNNYFRIKEEPEKRPPDYLESIIKKCKLLCGLNLIFTKSGNKADLAPALKRVAMEIGVHIAEEALYLGQSYEEKIGLKKENIV